MNHGEFIGLIQELRKEEGFGLRQLSQGVCGFRTIKSWLDGNWRLNMSFENHILERLGVNEEDFMYLVDRDAYECWETRQRILHNVTFGELEKAEGLLADYRKNYSRDNHIEEQFCLAMYAQIRSVRGASGEELSQLYGEALGKTVTKRDMDGMGAMVLSARELSLLLETERYRGEGERQERYEEVVEYIEKRKFHRAARGKIYPKAVYYLCRCVKEKGGFSDVGAAGRLLRYCEQAIELLRDCERMYYLWELLDMASHLVHAMAEDLARQGQPEKARILGEMHQEKAEWKQVLETVYGEKGVEKETWEEGYLYVIKGVSCYNDVIRVRRQMFGMRAEELCAGICDLRTLRRLEKGRTKTQWEIVSKLLKRLGLPGEYIRIELVAGRLEAYEHMRKLRDMVNLGKREEADALREQIRGMISMEYPCNRQVILNEELLSAWKQGEMDTETYCAKMRKALEVTLPYEAFLKEGEKYLTNEEQTCILNRMQGLDKAGGEFLICMRRIEEYYQPHIDAGLWEGVWNMYEFAMNNVGSMRGNRGEYDIADMYSGRVLEGCLRFRRMGVVHRCIYDRWWNYDQRKSSGIPTAQELHDEEELLKCVLFSYLARDERRIKNYKRKLDMVRERR